MAAHSKTEFEHTVCFAYLQVSLGVGGIPIMGGRKEAHFALEGDRLELVFGGQPILAGSERGSDFQSLHGIRLVKNTPPPGTSVGTWLL